MSPVPFPIKNFLRRKNDGKAEREGRKNESCCLRIPGKEEIIEEQSSMKIFLLLDINLNIWQPTIPIQISAFHLQIPKKKNFLWMISSVNVYRNLKVKHSLLHKKTSKITSSR